MTNGFSGMAYLNSSFIAVGNQTGRRSEHAFARNQGRYKNETDNTSGFFTRSSKVIELTVHTSLCCCLFSNPTLNMSDKAESKSVSLFREFLRLHTEHPTPDYESAVKFIEKQAREYGLDFERLE